MIRKYGLVTFKSNGKEATFESLLVWINGEMKSRMRATAPIRNHVTRIPVGHVVGSQIKCRFCSNQSHWTDQCLKFTALWPDDRMKAVHKASNCTQRRQLHRKSGWESVQILPPSLIAQSKEEESTNDRLRLKQQ